MLVPVGSSFPFYRHHDTSLTTPFPQKAQGEHSEEASFSFRLHGHMHFTEPVLAPGT